MGPCETQGVLSLKIAACTPRDSFEVPSTHCANLMNAWAHEIKYIQDRSVAFWLRKQKYSISICSQTEEASDVISSLDIVFLLFKPFLSYVPRAHFVVNNHTTSNRQCIVDILYYMPLRENVIGTNVVSFDKARRLHLLCSVCVHSFGALPKAVRLFIASIASIHTYSANVS